MNRDGVDALCDIGRPQTIPNQLEADRFRAAVLAPVPGVFSGHAGLEHGLDGLAHVIERFRARRAHVDFERAARHARVGSGRRLAAGAADGVCGFRRTVAEVRRRLHVGDLRDRRGHGLRRAWAVRAWRWRLELHLETVAADEVDDAPALETEIGDEVQGIGARTELLVEAVQLLDP